MQNIVKLIEQEIEWHVGSGIFANKGSLYEKGFVQGLKHARGLMKRLIASQQDASLDHVQRCHICGGLIKLSW